MAVSTVTARPEGRTGAPTEIRVVPAPRTEPPHDGELAALGIVPPPPSAPLLPLDLPTGAQVQSRRRRRSTRGDLGRGSAVGVVTADPADPARRFAAADALTGLVNAHAPDGRGALQGAPVTSANVLAGHTARSEKAAAQTVAEAPFAEARTTRPRDARAQDGRVATAHGLDGQTDGVQAKAPPAQQSQAQESQAQQSQAPELQAPELQAREAAARLTRLAIRRLIATCVEVLGGYRPVTQLRSFCAPECFETIVQRLLGRPASQRPGPSWRQASGPAHTAMHRGAPPRTGRVHQPGPPDRVTVRRVQVCPVSEEVMEVVAVLCRRDKVWAMAVRLELFDDRWLCTHLELV